MELGNMYRYLANAFCLRPSVREFSQKLL